ncbi:hypothetical protein [Nostoc sp. FACHB-133]|uniref:hypothetical protein n=1 Tax=Nostoc sp. FACHB-133 TaxID=2692835 RepID=UPI001683A7FE|nr:hypothetical protein [Nostoc sp. FACHB-133]MBD2525221.1 hypothetical protein [Nostoc sp. FACHB-133]
MSNQIIEFGQPNELFYQMSAEESANFNGGGLLTAAAYNTVATAFLPAGSKALIDNTTLLFTINSQGAPGTSVSP